MSPLSIRLVRWFLASLVLAWLASAHWPECVDDVYILADYGRQWARTGALTWTTGEHVEGFSSFALVIVAAIATRAGVAAEMALKLTAMASAVATLGLASVQLPTTKSGTVTLLGLSACAPFVYWAADGMDAAAFGLVLAAGWMLTLRESLHRALWVLAFAAVVRPEGLVHFLVAGVVLAFSAGWRGVVRAAFGPLASLGALMALRLWWFGALIPTPTLLKIVAVPWSPYGLRQAAGDIVPFVGLLLAVAPDPARRSGWLASARWLPLLVQVGVLGRASGDWMAHSRLLLPGAVASVLCAAEHARVRWSAGGWALVLPGLAAGALWLPVGYGAFNLQFLTPPGPAAVARDYGRGLVTPLPEDVGWVVEHVPDGSTVLVNDVGFLGGIPGINVLDLRGLTTRAVAEASAAGIEDEWLRGLLADPSRRPFAVRVAFWGEAPELPGWLTPAYPRTDRLTYPGGEVDWFSEEGSVPAVKVIARWAALSSQHPDHAWIRWRYALAISATGRDPSSVVVGGRSRFPRDDRFADPAAVRFVAGSSPLEWSDGFLLPPSAWVETPDQACEGSSPGLTVTGPPGSSALAAWLPVGVHEASLVLGEVPTDQMIVPSGGALATPLDALCPRGGTGHFGVQNPGSAGSASLAVRLTAG